MNRLRRYLATIFPVFVMCGCAFGPELTAESQPVFAPLNSFDKIVAEWPSVDRGLRETLINFNNQAKDIIRHRAYVGWEYRAILQEFESEGFDCAHHMNEENIIPHNLLVCERCTTKLEINPGVFIKKPGTYLERVAYYWWLDFEFSEKWDDEVDREVDAGLFVEQVYFRMSAAIQGLGRINRREQIPESSYLAEAGHKLCRKARRRLHDQTLTADFAQPQAIY